MKIFICNEPLNHSFSSAQTMGFGYLDGGNGGSDRMSPTATGVENSLRPSATGEEKYRRIHMAENNGCPGATGEEKYGRKIHMAENNGCPGPTGEENSLRGGAMGEEKFRRVHMFDKVVTPSDVGKLNRLVIPKLHAQKYFPLEAYQKERGLLLTFEDNTGKEWMFRYSYWSSSQSYVFTKGWNRFVREMDLHAGDIVSFQRAANGRNMQHHFYISWRRRSSRPPLLCSYLPTASHIQHLYDPPCLISSLAALQYNGGAAISSSTFLFNTDGAAVSTFTWLPNNGGAAISTSTSLPNSGGAAISSSASSPNSGGAAVGSLRLEETEGLVTTATGNLIAGGLGQNCDGERNAPFGQLNPGERPARVMGYPVQNTAAAGSCKRVRLFGVNL